MNKKVVKGVSWNFLRVMTQTSLSILVMAVLARQLLPEDFGVLTLALIFVGFGELLSSLGMGAAVIQKQNIDEKDLKTAQSFSVITGIILTFLCISLSEPAAIFYGNLELEMIITVLSFSLMINATGAVSKSVLIKKLEFKKLFFIDLTAYIIGYPIIAVLLAVNNYGVWSLVWGQIVLASLSSLLAILSAKIPFTLNIDRIRIKKLLNFGLGVSLNSSLNYIAANIDYVMIGRFLNDTSLGFYSRAYFLISLPIKKISVTITSVLFSSMSSIQDDKELVKKSYFQALEAMTLATFPILFVFYLGAEIIIVGVYGEQWYAAIDVFRILCLAGALKTVFHLSCTVVQSTGKIYSELKMQSIYFLFLLVGCYSLVDYGIKTIAWVGVVASLFLYFAMARLALKFINGQWRDFYAAQIPSLTLSLFIGVFDLIFIYFNKNILQLPHWLSLVSLIFLSAILFFTGFFILPKSLMGDSGKWVKNKINDKILRRIKNENIT